MVKRHAANSAEAPKVVFVGVVETVPGDDIEWRLCLLGCVEMTCELGQYGPVAVGVFVKVSNRGLEVTRIG